MITDDRGVRPVLRPSNTKVWFGPKGCTASPWVVAYGSGRLFEPERSWTQEGTDAHQLAADVLQLKADPPGRRNAIWAYLDEVYRQLRESRKADPGAQLLVEWKMPLFYDPEYLCTVDAAIVSCDTIKILDLKWGEGVKVDGVDNVQMLSYWRSLREELQARGWKLTQKYFSTTIVQPRYFGSESPTSTHVGEIEQALFITDAIAAEASDIWKKRNLRFHASEETCQFCPANAICKRARIAGLVKMPDTVEASDLKKLLIEPERVAEIFRSRKDIRSLLNKIEGHVEANVRANGDMAKYFTFVPGTRRGNAEWIDFGKACKELLELNPGLEKEELWEKPKPKSPNKVKQIISAGSDLIDTTLVTRDPPKPILVPKDEANKIAKEFLSPVNT